ncbi:MAG TPA: glycosyltransferase family 2 protein [Candidatus Bathyarchaeia archaeon]|nr:glycosyltransferase family 2 protein [Candidatus Bathyarchaeia archaeon]
MQKIKITAIIPAYNEEKNIIRVLKVVTKSPLIDEVIVVDNASTDRTTQQVRKFSSIKLVVNRKNFGIGYSYWRGAREAKNPLILLCDADLVGLKEEHLQQLIFPVIKKQTQMTIGIQEKLSLLNRFRWYRRHAANQKNDSQFIQSLGGQRVLWKKDFLKVRDLKKSKYGAVQTITNYFLENNQPFKNLTLMGVGHPWKIDKWGLKGILMEFDCLWAIVLNYAKTVLIKLKHKISPVDNQPLTENG